LPIPEKLNRPFLCYTGIETDLIFNQGIELPGFATFPLLETEEGRSLLKKSYMAQVTLAREMGCGVMFESATWVANRDRAAKLGYGPNRLEQINIDAIQFIRELSDNVGDVPIVLSAQVGPRGDGYKPDHHMDGYKPDHHMDDEEAQLYHSVQMAHLAKAKPDIVSAFTISYPEEAIGIVRAAEHSKLPVAISFTVETDGLLPTGMPLGEALDAVDAATDQYAEYFLINCAHPEHFLPNLNDGPWIERLAGVVVNASRCSHAELDNATELDDGDPKELGTYLGLIKNTYPHMHIFGGCCGADMRHMREIAKAVS
jgi:S-methylmethionine-dependent homocysteine/selenocysteine methylase